MSQNSSNVFGNIKKNKKAEQIKKEETATITSTVLQPSRRLIGDPNKVGKKK